METVLYIAHHALNQTHELAIFRPHTLLMRTPRKDLLRDVRTIAGMHLSLDSPEHSLYVLPCQWFRCMTEDRCCFTELYQPPRMEKPDVVRNAASLVHVVGHNDDGVVIFE